MKLNNLLKHFTIVIFSLMLLTLPISKFNFSPTKEKSVVETNIQPPLPTDFFGDWNYPEYWFHINTFNPEDFEITYKEPTNNNDYWKHKKAKTDGIGLESFRQYTSEFNTAIEQGYKGYYWKDYYYFAINNSDGIYLIDPEWNVLNSLKYLEDWIVWNNNKNSNSDYISIRKPWDGVELGFITNGNLSFIETISDFNRFDENLLLTFEDIEKCSLYIKTPELLDKKSTTSWTYIIGNDIYDKSYMNDQWLFIHNLRVDFQPYYYIPAFKDRNFYDEQSFENNKQSLYDLSIDNDGLSMWFDNLYNDEYSFKDFKYGDDGINGFEDELIIQLNSKFISLYGIDELGHDRMQGIYAIEDIRRDDLNIIYTDENGDILNDDFNDYKMSEFDQINIEISTSDTSFVTKNDEAINFELNVPNDIETPSRNPNNDWLFILIPIILFFIVISGLIIWFLKYKKMKNTFK